MLKNNYYVVILPDRNNNKISIKSWITLSGIHCSCTKDLLDKRTFLLIVGLLDQSWLENQNTKFFSENCKGHCNTIIKTKLPRLSQHFSLLLHKTNMQNFKCNKCNSKSALRCPSTMVVPQHIKDIVVYIIGI